MANADSPYDSVRDTVRTIFAELVGERAERLVFPPDSATSVASAALEADYKSHVAHDIAFHMTDWNEDAAFVVALHLFPDRFTPAEIRAGIEMFLVHAPAHTVAAFKSAKLMDHLTEFDPPNGE